MRVATYRRTVGADMARVWENVLDWEHLPWLHRSTFASVSLLRDGPDGWRARVALCGREDEPLEIEVVTDRRAGVYHTRTLDGPGAGTDIVTRLAPQAGGRTGIEVEFLVPAVAPDAAAAVGALYRSLYARLWDEDEAMMVRRQALLEGRIEPAWRELEVGGRRVRFETRCPHLGGPLDDAPVEDGCITCPWHGYRFDLRTGASADGRALCLRTAP